MTKQRLMSSIPGGVEVAAPSRSSLLGLYMRSHFAASGPKTKNRTFSRPDGRETALQGRQLTKTEDKEIIINRSGRSTYPEKKSVRRSGATHDHPIRLTSVRRTVLQLSL